MEEIKNKCTIAIAHPGNGNNTETFIQHHIEYLPYNVVELIGGFLPNKIGRGKNTSARLSKTLMFFSVIANKVFKKKTNYFIERAICKSLKKSNAKMILAEFGPTGMALVPICEKLKIPLITYFLGFDASVRSVIFTNANYASLFKKAHTIIGISQDVCEKLVALGCPKEKIQYNFCGAIDLFFEDEILENKPPVLIAVGRFVPKKAPYFTLMSFAKALKVVPDAKLIMIGASGELMDATAQLVKYYGIESNVELIGRLSPEKISELLQKSRAFVQHSIEALDGDSEGTPVIILEVGAQGVPVISTRHGGISEVIIHGKTGLLGPERDVDQMALFMIELLKDSDAAYKMGSNAREHVRSNFHITIGIRKLTAIIEKCLNPNQNEH